MWTKSMLNSAVEERRETLYDKAAEEGILKVLDLEGVAFRNELHYRLENPEAYQVHVSTIEHHVVDKAIKRFLKANKIEPTRPRGRRPSGAKYPHIFYRKAGVVSGRMPEIMKKKIDLSRFIFGLSSYAGFYAQNLWLEAFRDRGFNILEENTNEFEDKKASIEGDIDFIADKDGLRFGVEVKNGFAYPSDIKDKFRIAAELGVIPFIVVRRLPYKMRKWITDNGGLILPYGDGIYPFDCEDKTNECKDDLGLPIIMLKEIDVRFKDKIIIIYKVAFVREKEKRAKLDRYLKALRLVV